MRIEVDDITLEIFQAILANEGYEDIKDIVGFNGSQTTKTNAVLFRLKDQSVVQITVSNEYDEDIAPHQLDDVNYDDSDNLASFANDFAIDFDDYIQRPEDVYYGILDAQKHFYETPHTLRLDGTKDSLRTFDVWSKGSYTIRHAHSLYDGQVLEVEYQDGITESYIDYVPQSQINGLDADDIFHISNNMVNTALRKALLTHLADIYSEGQLDQMLKDQNDTSTFPNFRKKAEYLFSNNDTFVDYYEPIKVGNQNYVYVEYR